MFQVYKLLFFCEMDMYFSMLIFLLYFHYSLLFFPRGLTVALKVFVLQLLHKSEAAYELLCVLPTARSSKHFVTIILKALYKYTREMLEYYFPFSEHFFRMLQLLTGE